MNLKWTSEKPSAPGWYWWRGEGDIEGEILEIYVQTSEAVSELRAWLTKEEANYPLSTIKGQFAGPIPVPSP